MPLGHWPHRSQASGAAEYGCWLCLASPWAAMSCNTLAHMMCHRLCLQQQKSEWRSGEMSVDLCISLTNTQVNRPELQP